MKKLLWIGDAVASTGFARCTHRTLETLRKTWDVTVLGLNYNGDPHEYSYPIYPAAAGGDAFGLKRTKRLVEFVKPDLIVLQNDPWNIPMYMREIALAEVQRPFVVASMPVDGKNCQGNKINDLDLGIFWTNFGRDEAVAGGFTKPTAVVPLGVDLDLYKPQDQRDCRREVGFPDEILNCFVVGNVNRNQPRKRLDLTVRYFAKWVKEFGAHDAHLYLQIAPTGEQEYEVVQLMHYYGFRGEDKRLILVQPPIGKGIPEGSLPLVYGTFDVQISTTQGEGWGLTTMEGMACRIPQVVPDWAALGEWAAGAARLIPCSSTSVTPSGINVIGGIPDEEQTILALQEMYVSKDLRMQSGNRGLEKVSQPEFRWSVIGEKFAETLEGIL